MVVVVAADVCKLKGALHLRTKSALTLHYFIPSMEQELGSSQDPLSLPFAGTMNPGMSCVKYI